MLGFDEMCSGVARRAIVFLICGVSLVGPVRASGGGALEIRDGYFWDPQKGGPFIARGPAYQVWNPPVFANQSFDQVAYDLRQFVKVRANSVRAELVWGELEVAEDTYDWSRSDFLIATAERLGLKLFLLIGYQYPPSWFPEEQRGINDRGLRSDVLNYESTAAQNAYAEHIAAVVSRYKDSPAVGAWILGNEFAYFDLWEDPALFPARRMLGYDATSQAAFRTWLSTRYSADIAALNGNWGTSYGNFAEVVMPPAYPAPGADPGYHDVIQWRKQSIARFLARGAKAAKDNDPNHLITYSMVGGIFSGSDANNTCEEPVTIVEHCAAAGAPLDFWSVNNYAWATEGSELRSADFGIGKYQELIGLPVMISETGHTSTENLLPGAEFRQAEALPSTIWESLTSGAIGVHFFHWNDRNNFTEEFFIRERGFGILNQDRTIKSPVFEKVEALLRRMDELKIAQLLAGSRAADVDVLCYQTEEGDMGFPRGNQENAMLWGALRRLGYQVGFIGPEEFAACQFRTAKALLLSRSAQLEADVLDRILNEVIPEGLHVHANADLPGERNAYGQPNPNWSARMQSIFGLNVTNAEAVWDVGVSLTPGDTYRGLTLKGTTGFGSIPGDFVAGLVTWKIWHGLQPTAGITAMSHDGLLNEAPGTPALQFLDHGSAKAALNTYALGDTHATIQPPTPQPWDLRSSVVGAIYRDFFGIVPKIQLSGAKAHYVIADHRICKNGSVLISLLNEHVSPVSVTLNSAGLLSGKTVENLSEGGILESESDGILDLSLEGDEHLFLYVHDENGGADDSLTNGSPYRVWFQSAPQAVWPSVNPINLSVGFDTRGEALELGVSLEAVNHPRGNYGQSAWVQVSGQGSSLRSFPVLDPDELDSAYRSSLSGGQYRLRASLEKDGLTVAESMIPVRLVWGVRPLDLPPSVVAGASYAVEVEWEELAGYEQGEAPNTIERADLFETAAVLSQHYNIVLELRDHSEAVVASDVWVTRQASGRRVLNIDVPAEATGPFHWYAYNQTASGASNDTFESFEGWETGEAVPFGDPTGSPKPDITLPWEHYTYTHLPLRDPMDEDYNPFYLNHGVHIEASHGSQSVFTVLHNHAEVGDFAGYGLRLVLDSPISLPSDPVGLEDYVFSFDFRENVGLPARLEVQLKDSAGAIIFLAKDYDPQAGAGRWDSVRGKVSEFIDATWLPAQEFNYAEVVELICNIGLVASGEDRFYGCALDNIRFDGPEQVVLGGAIDGFFDSRNDSLVDTDGDGVPDVHETGTGTYSSSTDTGTDPENADSDGDGQSDGAELIAGSDPHERADLFLAGIEMNGAGEIQISWYARTGRRYAIEFCDPERGSESITFRALQEVDPIEVAVDGELAVSVSIPAGVPARLYRVVVWRKGR